MLCSSESTEDHRGGLRPRTCMRTLALTTRETSESANKRPHKTPWAISNWSMLRNLCAAAHLTGTVRFDLEPTPLTRNKRPSHSSRPSSSKPQLQRQTTKRLHRRSLFLVRLSSPSFSFPNLDLFPVGSGVPPRKRARAI